MEGFHRQEEGGARKLFAKVGIISDRDYYFWGKEMPGVLALQTTSLVLTQKPQIGWLTSPGEGGPGVTSRFGVMGCSTRDKWQSCSLLCMFSVCSRFSNLALSLSGLSHFLDFWFCTQSCQSHLVTWTHTTSRILGCFFLFFGCTLTFFFFFFTPAPWLSNILSDIRILYLLFYGKKLKEIPSSDMVYIYTHSETHDFFSMKGNEWFCSVKESRISS